MKIITSVVVYTNSSIDYEFPMFGRYTPSRDLIHYQSWRYNGAQLIDWTNHNGDWGLFYYPRRQQNIPSNENIYDLKYIFYGSGTETLWDYIR